MAVQRLSQARRAAMKAAQELQGDPRFRAVVNYLFSSRRLLQSPRELEPDDAAWAGRLAFRAGEAKQLDELLEILDAADYEEES